MCWYSRQHRLRNKICLNIALNFKIIFYNYIVSLIFTGSKKKIEESITHFATKHWTKNFAHYFLSFTVRCKFKVTEIEKFKILKYLFDWKSNFIHESEWCHKRSTTDFCSVFRSRGEEYKNCCAWVQQIEQLKELKFKEKNSNIQFSDIPPWECATKGMLVLFVLASTLSTNAGKS